MSTDLVLAPVPRSLTVTEGVFPLPAHALLALRGAQPADLLFSAQQLQHELAEQAGVTWEIVAGTAMPGKQIGAELCIAPDSTRHPEGYNLTITPSRIAATASTPAGIFYAVQTLRQLLRRCGATVPTLRCVDWPDFPNRGVMLDVSRNKVPTLETTMALIDRLAEFKINQFQLYTEHTFAYRLHPKVWADASPFTGEEILALDAFCRDRFVELVPNQNTFGHLHRWLEHPEYRHLAEAPDGAHTPWDTFDPRPFSLAPVLPESLDLVRDMLDELLPHFRSAQVNIGGDETYDVGQGRSKDLADAVGKERVYLDFLLKIYREARSRGRAMQFWGDIIMEHPELTVELPHDAIAMEWGYEADHPFDEHGAIFAQSGVPFYVVPGASGWNAVAARSSNARENLRNAARAGREHGAIGYLITEWGDRGHWQPLSMAYAGFVYGAALAWHGSQNEALDVASVLDLEFFGDDAGTMARTIMELGDVYLQSSVRIHNMSILFAILQATPEEFARQLDAWPSTGNPAAELEQMLAAIEEHQGALGKATPRTADGKLSQQEAIWCSDMLAHACRRGLWLLNLDTAEEAQQKRLLADELGDLLRQHGAIWQARNRPGGFDDSQALLARLRADYA